MCMNLMEHHNIFAPKRNSVVKNYSQTLLKKLKNKKIYS